MDVSITFETMLSKMSKPASSALIHARIDSYDKLTKLTEKQFLSLHGIGKASLPTVNHYLNRNGLSFSKE